MKYGLLVQKPSPECGTCTLEIRDSLGQPAAFQLCFLFPCSASGEIVGIRKLPEEGKCGGGCCSAGAWGGLTSGDVLPLPEQHTPDLLAFPVVSKDAHQLLTSMISGSMLSLYWELRNHFVLRSECTSPGISEADKLGIRVLLFLVLWRPGFEIPLDSV